MKCDICGKQEEVLDCYTGFDIYICSECWCNKNVVGMISQANKIFKEHRTMIIKMMQDVRGGK